MAIRVLLLALIPATATAGNQALYSIGWGGIDIIESDDHGTIRIESNSGLDLVDRHGELSDDRTGLRARS